MKNAATERGKGFRDRRGGGGKCLENGKKILNRGNELKDVLKIQELWFSEAQNELLFERQKPPSNPKIRPKISEKAVASDRKAVPQQEFVGGLRFRQSAEKHTSKLNERSANLYENKGSLWKTRGRSLNVFENKGT